MEKKLNSKEIYKGKILTLMRDEVCIDDKNIAYREVIHHRGGVTILAKINDKFIFVKQFRYATKEELLELPAGKLEENDISPLSAAMRELEEETGYKTNNLTFLGKVYLTPGYSDEVNYIYYTDNLIKTKQHLDEDERIDLLFLTYEQFKKAIIDHEIIDSKTIIAFAYYNEIIMKNI